MTRHYSCQSQLSLQTPVVEAKQAETAPTTSQNFIYCTVQTGNFEVSPGNWLP